MTITREFQLLNYAEAGLWALIAVGCIIAASRRPTRAPLLVAGGAFLLFGLSDVVEASTGAWWRPWWLLVWKGLCLLVFAALLLRYVRARRAT